MCYPAFTLYHSLSRFDGLEAWKTSKLQNRRPLFDVELYLTVHKAFVSISLNIIHRGRTFHFNYIPIGRLLDYKKYNELNRCDCAQININSDKNIIQ